MNFIKKLACLFLSSILLIVNMQINVLAVLEELDPERFSIIRAIYENKIFLAKDLQTDEFVTLKHIKCTLPGGNSLDVYNSFDHIQSFCLHKPIGYYMDKDGLVLVFPHIPFCALDDKDQIISSVGMVRAMIYHVLLGLVDLHSSDLVHRDVKPDNIFFWYDLQGLLHACIGDCDYVIPVGIRLRTTSGSFTTAAAECYGPVETNPSADMYALGCTWLAFLWEIYGCSQGFETERECWGWNMAICARIQKNIEQDGRGYAIEMEFQVLREEIPEAPENDLWLIAKMLVGTIENLPGGFLRVTRISSSDLLADPLWGDTPMYCQDPG